MDCGKDTDRRLMHDAKDVKGVRLLFSASLSLSVESKVVKGAKKGRKEGGKAVLRRLVISALDCEEKGDRQTPTHVARDSFPLHSYTFSSRDRRKGRDHRHSLRRRHSAASRLAAQQCQ